MEKIFEIKSIIKGKGAIVSNLMDVNHENVLKKADKLSTTKF